MLIIKNKYPIYKQVCNFLKSRDVEESVIKIFKDEKVLLYL
jgi:hypothetical protein